MRVILQENMKRDLKEFTEKLYIIEQGLSQYTKIRLEEVLGSKSLSDLLKTDLNELSKKLYVNNPAKDPKEVPPDTYKSQTENTRSTEEIIQTPEYTAENDVNKIKQSPIKFASVKQKIETIGTGSAEIPPIELSEKDKRLLQKLEEEHEKKIKKKQGPDDQHSDKPPVAQSATGKQAEPRIKPKPIPRPEPNVKPKDTVSTIFLSIMP